jgi:hypothetical protein
VRGGVERSLEAAGPVERRRPPERVDVTDLVGDLDLGLARDLLFDPETSGGLLISVPDLKGEALRTAFQATGEPLWEIGRVAAGTGLKIRAR